MNTQFKIDLYNDEQLAEQTTQVGDVLSLDVPDGQGNVISGKHKVTAIEERDAGTHPQSLKHLTRVTLTLEEVTNRV